MKRLLIDKLFYVGMIVLFSGCVKRYKSTTKLCDGRLYMEVYNINPAGVDAAFLTDSVNFRVSLGEFDNEHENYNCYCKGDTVIIRKLASVDTSVVRQVVNEIRYSFKKLTKSN